MSETGVPKELLRLIDAYGADRHNAAREENEGFEAYEQAVKVSRASLEAAIERHLRANQGERERSNP